MTIKDWENAIDNLPKDKREELSRAISTLKEWSQFKNEFQWTGIFGIGALLKEPK